jgi:hypothetical protein
MAVKKSKIFLIIGIVLGVIVLVGAFVWPFHLGKMILKSNQSWYAVHLTNGVVYVGQIKSISDDKIELKKAYYMQSYGAANNNEGQPAQFYGLIQQGTEAPLLTYQEMSINKPVILFWEQLKQGSDIVNKLNQHD